MRRTYKKLWKKDPVMANVYLLMAELADNDCILSVSDEELTTLLNIRFNDPSKDFAL